MWPGQAKSLQLSRWSTELLWLSCPWLCEHLLGVRLAYHPLPLCNKLYSHSVPALWLVRTLLGEQIKHIWTWPWVLHRSLSNTLQGQAPAIKVVSPYALSEPEASAPVSKDWQLWSCTYSFTRYFSFLSWLPFLAWVRDVCVYFCTSKTFGNVGPRTRHAPHLQVLGFAEQSLRHLLSCLFSLAVTFHSSKEWDHKPLQQTLLSQEPTSWITSKPAKCQQCEQDF